MLTTRPWMLIAIAIASFGSVIPRAAAQSPAVNGLIAFTDCGFGPFGEQQCDIWIMNPDGSGKINLTNTPDLNEIDPAWSQDGTRIAYVEGSNFQNHLMVMNADGSGQTVITAERSYQFGPTWSPGGTRLAFVREVPGDIISTQFDILAVNVDGTSEVNLTNSDFDELDPAWAPDGSTIAFAGVRFESTVDPITGEPGEAAQWEIVAINPDGSGEQILTAGEPGSMRRLRLEEDRAPSWSPDSTHLVFMTQSVDPCCPPWQIAEVDRSGTAVTALSDNPDVNDLGPEYSPDGTLIVFTSDRDAIQGGDFDIYTMPVPPRNPAAFATLAAAAGVTRLTASGRATDPAWGRHPAIPPGDFTLAARVGRLGRGGGGVIVSSPGGIMCSLDCTETYPAGTVVALFALPNRVSWFVGWTGACSGRSTVCVVKMDDVRRVGATFLRVR